MTLAEILALKAEYEQLGLPRDEVESELVDEALRSGVRLADVLGADRCVALCIQAIDRMRLRKEQRAELVVIADET